MIRLRPLLMALCLAPGLVATGAAAQVRLHGEANGSYSLNVVSWRDLPFRTVVRQQYDFSCGSAAVATLLTYHYGRPTTESEAFKAMYAAGDQAKIRKVGFSMLDMKHFLSDAGFQADGYRLSLEQLAKSNMPAIALIQLGRYRHFVVVKGVRGDAVLVGDPAFGARVIPAAEFRKLWNGVAFAIHPERRGAFNAARDWSLQHRASLQLGLQPLDAAALTRDLAPLYQISPVAPTVSAIQ